MLRINLNNHPNIYIPPESPFIIHLYKKYKNKEITNIEEFISDLKQAPFFNYWDVDFEKLKATLKKTDPPSFQNFCTVVLNLNCNNNIILGEKNSTNTLFGKYLIKIYPKAKFIWLIRDYRAQVNSMLKVNFEKKIISSLAARWVSYNKQIEKFKHTYPNHFLLIKYEELVENPEKYYQHICNFLEIEYEKSILKTIQDNTPPIHEYYKSLSEEINTNHIEEWKTGLTTPQIKICENVAGNYGEKFGYKKIHPPISSVNLLLYLGVLHVKLYIPFIKTMYKLPLKIRVLINEKIFHKYTPFWKPLKKYFLPF